MPESSIGAAFAGDMQCTGHDARLLNAECFCVSLDKEALYRALASEAGNPQSVSADRRALPHVFAERPVFVSSAHAKGMEKVISALESVMALPAYREQILAHAPAIARHDPRGAKGVFFGYDFHIGQHGAKLIEINTNAGGAMLSAILARAQRACCGAVEAMLPMPDSVAAFEQRMIDMFHAEWAPSASGRPLRSIAIVDEAPGQQYLYPEFLLFQRLFRQHGLEAVITDPSELELRDGVLWCGNIAIDLVYNRLTDFMLEAPSNATLRAAYLQHAAVLTPHPQAHALYADKRNLALLTDRMQLSALGVPEATRAILLSGIPHTEIVSATNADRLWNERRRLFFKPTAGFGGRAAYRGDKLTRRVWQEILAGAYVAQSIIAPGERMIDQNGLPQALKFDLRNYAYDGKVQWLAARLYQGQTTNFRTPGGGFAPVYSLPAASSHMPQTVSHADGSLTLTDAISP